MDILLINPWIYDFKAYDFWLKPLGLLYIASILRDNGFNIKIIDCLNRYHPALKDKKLKTTEWGTGKFYYEEIEKPDIYKNVPRKYKRYGLPIEILYNELNKILKPNLIMITSIMTYWYPAPFHIIKILKSIFPDVPIILGGIYTTLCYEHAKMYSGADFVFKGRNLKDIVNLVNNILNLKKIPNIPEEPPYPAYDLLENFNQVRYVPILTSFGCPYNCSYCASSILYDRFYQRNPLSVVKEIEYYVQRWGIKNIAFYDDALLINYDKHLGVILNLLKQRNIKLFFHTPNGLHVKFITQKVAEELFESGFKTIRLGFETSYPNRQKQTGNKVTNDDFKKALNNLIKAGFTAQELGVYVMIGLPGQKYDEIIDSIQFVHDCGSKVRLAQFSPIPGTYEWKKFIITISDYVDRNRNIELIDPLIYNNTIYRYFSYEITKEQVNIIEQKVKELNLNLGIL